MPSPTLSPATDCETRRKMQEAWRRSQIFVFHPHLQSEILLPISLQTVYRRTEREANELSSPWIADWTPVGDFDSMGRLASETVRREPKPREI